MFISIIVPAYNEERLLGAALKSIQQAAGAFAQRRWEYELIVCDNNSNDRTAELARTAGALVVFEPLNQISRARNSGARAAKGHWLFFIDADSQPVPGLFEDAADAISSGRCLAGGTTLRLDTNHRLANRATGFWNWISRTFRVLAGSFIFCEAAAFREVGGFNEQLFAGEEIDLTKKLKRLGRRLGRELVILNRHPMLTSGRKVHLYTIWEHVAVLGRAVFTRNRSLREKRHCATWYDGRR